MRRVHTRIQSRVGMRASIRVLPLLVVAAHLAACANDVARKNDALRHAAVTSPAHRAARSAARDQPDQALLARQPSPQCERSKPLEGVPADQARVALLDYEQQCYRQLAERAHTRLIALQDAAAKRRSFGSAHQALLERVPPVRCEPARPAAGLSQAEAREASLEAERQCYKQLEASERQKINALQDALRVGLNPGRT